MSSVLHVTNGDGAAGLLRASHLEGDVLPWRDPMHYGPFPSGADLRELSTIRGRHLAGPDLPEADVVRDFELRNEHFLGASRYEEVVLWFEHDLLDQLQILQILDLVASGQAKPRRLSMVCIDRFEGVEGFRGLGQLTPDQVATLWSGRMDVSQDLISLASAGWAAFRSDDPQNLERFLTADLSALPFLAAALRRHLEEYPAADTGLTRTEGQILNLIAAGVQSPVDLFIQNMELETVLFIGDWTTFSRVEELCLGPSPLLQCSPGGTFHHPPSDKLSRKAFAAQALSLSQEGRDVQAGLRSARPLRVRDEWLGGVHLNSGEPMWVWDRSNQKLTLQEPTA
ncbi:MAG: hypothetical protein AAGF81_09525 [Pseudomonadota bacterium]